jgi:hypothetical protein
MILEPLEKRQDDGVSVAVKYILESAQFLVGISEVSTISGVSFFTYRQISLSEDDHAGSNELNQK